MNSGFCTFVTDTGTTLQAVEASMTMTRGVSPSVCKMQVADYDGNSLTPYRDGSVWTQGANGTLIFGDGINGSVVMPGCRVLEQSIEKDTNSWVSTLHVADRRWRWGGVPLSYLEWNTRDMQGTVVDVDADRSSAFGIGTYLLQAELGEGTYDVQLPDGTTPGAMPFFRWERAVPSACLQELCELYDASVVLAPATNMIRIMADGSTIPEPATATLYQREETRFLGDPIPKYMLVYGGMRRVEVDLPLTPVVLDVDGSVKTYGFHDSNGSRATNGTRDCSWLPVNLPSQHAHAAVFARNAGTTAAANTLRAQIKECAGRSFLRWYQLPGTATLYTEGDEGTDLVYAPALWRKVVLERNALENVDGDIRYAKAQVFGTGVAKHEADDYGVSRHGRTGILKGQFGYEQSSGIVRLAEPVGNVAESGSIEPGTLWLRAVVCDVPSAWVGTSFNGSDTSVEAGYFYSEAHDDLVWEYGSNGTNNGTAINAALMSSLGQSYVDVMVQKYERILQNNPTKVWSYPGIHAFSCDGYYQQVTWTMGWNKPPVTVVSKDCDSNVRASSDMARQAVWQGKMWRERQNRAAKAINEQFKTDPSDSEFD